MKKQSKSFKKSFSKTKFKIKMNLKGSNAIYTVRFEVFVLLKKRMKMIFEDAKSKIE